MENKQVSEEAEKSVSRFYRNALNFLYHLTVLFYPDIRQGFSSTKYQTCRLLLTPAWRQLFTKKNHSFSYQLCWIPRGSDPPEATVPFFLSAVSYCYFVIRSTKSGNTGLRNFLRLSLTYTEGGLGINWSSVFLMSVTFQSSQWGCLSGLETEVV